FESCDSVSCSRTKLWYSKFFACLSSSVDSSSVFNFSPSISLWCVSFPQSALFNFHSFLTVVLLVICTCTYVKMHFPAILEHKTGFVLAVTLSTFCFVVSSGRQQE
ncbi:unnamed protein product, partial [Linum tenue]